MPGKKKDPGPTPVQAFEGWWAKRHDLACGRGPGFPGGAKLQAWYRLAALRPGCPLVIGCAANSTAQVAAAAAGEFLGREVIVYVAGRATETDATQYARWVGATVIPVRPGYLSCCRSRAAAHVNLLNGSAVTWDPAMVAACTAAEVGNLPVGVRRVIVPTGAGATAGGVMAGLAAVGRQDVRVLALAVSTLATVGAILGYAAGVFGGPLPPLELRRAAGPYDRGVIARLPNGDPLDPFTGPRRCHMWCRGIAFGYRAGGPCGPCRRPYGRRWGVRGGCTGGGGRRGRQPPGRRGPGRSHGKRRGSGGRPTHAE